MQPIASYDATEVVPALQSGVYLFLGTLGGLRELLLAWENMIRTHEYTRAEKVEMAVDLSWQRIRSGEKMESWELRFRNDLFALLRHHHEQALAAQERSAVLTSQLPLIP